jgi:hypothetical protein
MCTIISKSKRKSFTGYKVALKINGKYYSPATGVEYVVGDVPIPERIIEEYRDDCFVNVINPSSYCHRPGYMGHTAVFIRVVDKIMVSRRSNAVLLKMKISGNMLNCEFREEDTIAGTHIDSFKEI